MTDAWIGDDAKEAMAYVFSGLGAVGVALQNYQAVALFISSVSHSHYLSAGFAQAIAFTAGGACSGIVNFWMNVKLLKAFFNRIMANKPYQYETLNTWERIQYFGGIAIFIVTGILFGLMAFTFALEGPLAILSIAVGVFVAGIMTIQEVETWLMSWDPQEKKQETALTASQQWGKGIGHLIAIGNVIALSLGFTLGLTQMMMLYVSAFPALMIGLSVAFTIGAFTEYYFYHFYLADFCKDFADNWALFMRSPMAFLGLLSVTTNALVNAALTYSGIELLAVLMVTAGIALPPAAVMMVLSVACALFAGSASFILGMDFWIGDRSEAVPAPSVVEATNMHRFHHGPVKPVTHQDDKAEILLDNYALGCCA